MRYSTLLAALSLIFLLAACSTTRSTNVTTYDEAGQPVASTTSSSSTSDTMDALSKAGTAVKDGAVAGYEWTKDKTVKGYNWVKDKVQESNTPAQ
ncbi:MAG: hypothetical protein IJB29_02985 [Mailhella sp.]|nr:hypothetical protein [Mailhella sp.]